MLRHHLHLLVFRPKNVAEIKIVPTVTFEQSSNVEVDAMTAALDSSIAFNAPASEPSSKVTAVQRLINLEEEPIATNVEEDLKAAVNPTTV